MISRANIKPKTVTTRLIRGLWIGLAILVLVLTLTLLNNNLSFRRPSRAVCDAQLDRALEQATEWISANPAISERNPAIMYMIADMENISHDPRLEPLLDDYRKNYLSHPKTLFDLVWFRLVNRNASVPIVPVPDMQNNVIDFVWFAHALAPDRILLSDADRDNLFSATKYFWGTRQKQLMALAIYRNFNGSTPDLNNTINYLAEKVARDAHYDFRVSDNYVQRTAFILAAGRPDLVRRRWVERILDHQNADGSWNSCWYGWCRGVAEFKLHDSSDGHATVQAAWALTMLKYLYPQWIALQCHD